MNVKAKLYGHDGTWKRIYGGLLVRGEDDKFALVFPDEGLSWTEKTLSNLLRRAATQRNGKFVTNIEPSLQPRGL